MWRPEVIDWASRYMPRWSDGSAMWRVPGMLTSYRAGRLIRSCGACLGCWRSCRGAGLMRTRGPCRGCWRSCLGGRLIHARGIMPAVWGSCLGCWRSCLGGRLIHAWGCGLGCWCACLGGRSVATSRRMPGVLARMPRRTAMGRDRAACPAQRFGIAADRFAREIVGIMEAFRSALAAAECQTVGPHSALAIG